MKTYYGTPTGKMTEDIYKALSTLFAKEPKPTELRVKAVIYKTLRARE